MASLAAAYRLKRFRDSRDPDFAAALMLYVRNTEAAIRTETNEIAYWLDHFESRFGNPFYVFGFYRDRQLIGYAEAAYLRSERLLIFDYLVIDGDHRRNNIFFEFVDHLKRYFEDAHPDYRYAVIEVPYGVAQKYPSQESCLLTRLFKLQGFRVIRAPYCQPRLVLEDAESEMQADLLIFSTSSLDKLRTTTYLSIVHAIYYLYYLPWKSLAPGATDGYEKHVDALYMALRRSLGRSETVVVNGHKKILNASVRRSAMTVHRIVLFAGQALIVVILLTAALLGLKAGFHLSDMSFAVVYGIAITSFVGLAGIVSKDARLVFLELTSLAKHLLPRRQGGAPEGRLQTTTIKPLLGLDERQPNTKKQKMRLKT